MLKEILIADVTLLVAIFVMLLVWLKKKRNDRYSNQIREIEKKLANAIQVEKIPKMEEEQFVSSSSSKKYHKIECRLANNIKNKEFGSKEEFKKKKYSPCGICLKK